MNFSELVFKYLPLVKRHWLPLSLGILGMIFFVSGLIGLFADKQTGLDDVVFEASSKDKPAQMKTILIDVEGAVENPGLYKLPQESRIQDALIAAGGMAATADREYIAKNINLAIRLTDGAKIYVPFLGELITAPSVLSASSGEISVGSLININIASETQLDSLPGIGPVTAQKIIVGRPYGSIDELLNKKIVGAKVFDQIKSKISIY